MRVSNGTRRTPRSLSLVKEEAVDATTKAGANRKSLLARLLLVVLCLQLAGCAATRGLGAEDAQRVRGKTYVITGASSGFGRGTALMLGDLGANVVLAARRGELLEQVAVQVRARGGQALAVPADVAKMHDVASLAQRAVERFGRIDVWINNAGVGAIGRFEQIPPQDHARLIDVNLKGVIFGSHAALRQFTRQGYGTLVNIGSVESEVPLAYQASYAASKAAVLSLGRALNEEMRLAGQDKVAVATVLPWAVDTPFFAHTANYSGTEARPPFPDDVCSVVKAIVWASLHPYEELPVGWKAWGAYLGHRVLPDLSEQVAAQVEHRIQIAPAGSLPGTSGNLHRPAPAAVSPASSCFTSKPD